MELKRIELMDAKKLHKMTITCVSMIAGMPARKACQMDAAYFPLRWFFFLIFGAFISDVSVLHVSAMDLFMSQGLRKK
jgi:hypothetical protein